MFAKVIIDIAHTDVDRSFTYRVPESIEISVGQRVLVPFGAGNKPKEGFVLSLQEKAEECAYQIKSIIRTLEPYSAFSQEQLELARWMQKSYHCVLAEALRLMIPAELRGGRVKEKSIRLVELAKKPKSEEMLSSLMKKDGSCRAPKQKEILELLIQIKKPMSVFDLCSFVPGGGAAIRALLDKGFIIEEGFVTFRDPFAHMKSVESKAKSLFPDQQNALEAVCKALNERSGTLLLHGVTGSGKTEVYLQAIAKVISENGTAIVLVPEIALTPQTVERFRGRFGNRVAVLHSRLSAGERYDEWRRIRLGAVSVVVGARSAVFAPLSNLRLIVIDEEHEPSYVSETSPRYSAVETAAKRCALNGAVLLLGSATPSLFSYYRALHGRYTLLNMPERVNGVPMPSVEIADMRDEFMRGNTSIFSGILRERLQSCLDAGEQAILFINRRGYSTFVSCRGCGYVFRCPNCDISLTYHKHDELLKCHYCGHSQRLPKNCPSCGKPYIKYFGIGTQQVEEALAQEFPGVVSLRMDLDTTQGKNSHYEILQGFTSGKAQVLIGTQMVAKGLDIPNVTLVGIIAADSTLHIPDFRSVERTFQLTTQVAGRAGRDEKPGHVIIQTYSPEHPAIIAAAAHDYVSFYNMEIEARKTGMFPPFSIFARVLFSGPDEAPLISAAEGCAETLRERIENALLLDGGEKRELLWLYASPAPILRRQGEYRYQVLLKLARTKHAQAALEAIYDYSSTNRSKYQSALEINPQNLF